jgi:hypothetical protein
VLVQNEFRQNSIDSDTPTTINERKGPEILKEEDPAADNRGKCRNYPFKGKGNE